MKGDGNMALSRKKSVFLVLALVLTMAFVLGACGKGTSSSAVKIEKVEDLEGKKIGVQVSTTAHDSCKEYLEKFSFDLQTYDQVIMPFQDLKAGRLDAVVVDAVVAKYYIATDSANYKVAVDKLTNEPIGICVKKENTDLRDKLEQVLAQLKEEGKLAEISKQWFGDDLTADVEGAPTDTSDRGAIPEGMKKLRVGVDDSYPPMEFKNEKNETVGFDIDVAKAIGEKLGLEVEFVSTAWDGIFASLNTDKFDCIISSVSINEDRQQNFAMTKPYIANAQVVVVKP